MRKIEKEMLQAIKNKTNFHKGNTSIVYYPAIETETRVRIETSKVFLHGNHIATVIHEAPYNGRVVINKDTLAQWPTMITASRLCALGHHVNISKGQAYINGELCKGN